MVEFHTQPNNIFWEGASNETRNEVVQNCSPGGSAKKPLEMVIIKFDYIHLKQINLNSNGRIL
jgi:hypothetical protein